DAAPFIGIEIEGDIGSHFSFRSTKAGAADPLFSTLESYPRFQRERLTVSRPKDRGEAAWLHPGDPVFERFRGLVSNTLGDLARRGAVFVDPTAIKPYLFHLARLNVVRQSDKDYAEFAQEEVLECRLVGVKQFEGAEITLCPVEQLLLF